MILASDWLACSQISPNCLQEVMVSVSVWSKVRGNPCLTQTLTNRRRAIPTNQEVRKHNIASHTCINFSFCLHFSVEGIQSGGAAVALRQAHRPSSVPHEDLRPQPCGGQVPLLVLRLPAEEDEEGVRRDSLLWPGERTALCAVTLFKWDNAQK